MLLSITSPDLHQQSRTVIYSLNTSWTPCCLECTSSIRNLLEAQQQLLNGRLNWFAEVKNTVFISDISCSRMRCVIMRLTCHRADGISPPLNHISDASPALRHNITVTFLRQTLKHGYNGHRCQTDAWRRARR